MMLADLVRTDRHNHRQLGEDSELAEAIKVLARSHKSLIWTRQQLGNQPRSALREFYPGALEAFGADLYEAHSLALLERAPTPAQGRALSLAKITSALRRAGRRNVEQRAVAIRDAPSAPQLEQPAVMAQAHGVAAAALAGVLQSVIARIHQLEKELDISLKAHPAAEIYLSLPGLATVLGARALAEFGDDPNGYQDGKARKNYAGTQASGRTRWCWPGSFATSGSPTPASGGPSPPSPPRRAPGATTTLNVPGTRATGKRCASWPTVWLASSTAACATVSYTARTSPGQWRKLAAA